MASGGTYRRGTMDIDEQRRTYGGVMKATLWCTAFVVLLLVLMALFLL